MSFKEWTKNLKDRALQSGLFGAQERGQESNMANGGFSGYRPAQSKPRENRDTQSVPVMPMGEAMAQPGYDAPQGGTGFTGMFPPAAGPMNGTAQYPPFLATGAYPPVGGYPPQNPGQGGAYSGQNWQATTTYAPQQPYQEAYQQPQGRFQQPNTAYHSGMTGRMQPVGGGNPAMAGTGRYQPPGASQQPQDNIRYMPGTFVGDDGKAYNHVERVAQLVSVSACYRIIEFMRNGESVIVNTESIASDGEIQRCMDMLSGAAFTLGCSITKITQVKRAYLIAPATVLVMPDMVFQRMSDRESSRWRQDGDTPQESRRADRRGYAQESEEDDASRATYRPETRESAPRGGLNQGYAQARANNEPQQTPQGFGGFGGFGTTGFGQ